MTRRGGFIRMLVLALATFQSVAPAGTAVAHGLSLADAPAPAVAHVESAGSPCPEAHTPDCGVCRYLTTGVNVPAGACGQILGANHDAILRDGIDVRGVVSTTFPPGRAPPVL